MEAMVNLCLACTTSECRWELNDQLYENFSEWWEERKALVFLALPWFTIIGSGAW